MTASDFMTSASRASLSLKMSPRLNENCEFPSYGARFVEAMSNPLTCQSVVESTESSRCVPINPFTPVTNSLIQNLSFLRRTDARRAPVRSGSAPHNRAARAKRRTGDDFIYYKAARRFCPDVRRGAKAG